MASYPAATAPFGRIGIAPDQILYIRDRHFPGNLAHQVIAARLSGVADKEREYLPTSFGEMV